MCMLATVTCIYLSTAPAVAMETSSLRLRTDVMLLGAAWEKSIKNEAEM